ncbi:15-hydroxyprostaglandin dehydrogenase [nad(+)] [Holotrichia oblita]|uniref:15-hydroxyprostaglandin dehydrogenase [nad(+)] n=2 Tax=Holotrichia oblita TaxID=644536 RepID=A0ACB9TX43_HOLOL|nr:15-hydroxyprostaglandin dehydrogenase [nad(+)] [Holotrichia oblita]KAI4471369.1 15-hydroxyprostaglandin dehydrogenase [nad(+)] [Holotrichia oblita]
MTTSSRLFLKHAISLVTRRNNHHCPEFCIEGKTALVTGAASGLGLAFAKALLACGLKGCAIGDINEEKGKQAVQDLNKEFGKGKAFFLKTNVICQNEVEDLFQKTIRTYNNLDIVINNAGIYDDSKWERQIAININGTIYGSLLGWEYLQKYKTCEDTVIVNLASITGLTAFKSTPLYSSTKHCVVGLTRGMGVKDHFDRVKIRVVAICPGVTDTAMITDFTPENCLPEFRPTFEDDLPKWPHQQAEIVAEGLIQAVQTGMTGSFTVISGNKIQYIPRLPEVLELPK